MLAQRLVRALCPHCKHKRRHTGHLGRIGIYETMVLTPARRQRIQPDTDAAVLRAVAIKEGMQPLHLSGARKVYAGLTTFEEVKRVAPPTRR